MTKSGSPTEGEVGGVRRHRRELGLGAGGSDAERKPDVDFYKAIKELGFDDSAPNVLSTVSQPRTAQGKPGVQRKPFDVGE